MVYCFVEPPIMRRFDTPGIAESSCRSTVSAYVLRSDWLTASFSAESHTHMISHKSALSGAIEVCTESGRLAFWSRSNTCCRLTRFFVSHPNSTLMTESPCAELDLTASTQGMFENILSSGEVTIFSTSSVPSPSASAKMVTRGLLRSGRTSIGSCPTLYMPNRIRKR